MPIAFKEWAVTVRALAEGEQLLTLRKGGIREPEKHFKLDYERFFLYPTFDHQCADLVRQSHQPELARALEEGVWSDGEPPPHALRRDIPISQPDRVRIRAWAEVAAHYTVTDRRTVDALSPFYVWTPDYAEKRLAWVESVSPSFRAGHSSEDADDADRVLCSLERARQRLERVFPRLTGELTVVLHPGFPGLSLTNPLLPLTWLLTAPAARRYVAG